MQIQRVERPERTRRAAPMAPEARREMIVDAALPLILEHGERVTTRQIADAAGIAEGTIFRAFADKDDVIGAVVARALDPTRLDEELGTIDLAQPFEKCVAAAIAIIQLRVIDVWQLLSAVGPRFHDHHPRPRPPLPALVRLFEAHREQLAVKPTDAAQRLRALTLATTHPALNDAPLSSRDVTKQFLYGVHAAERLVLIKLLRTHLRPYRKVIIGVVVLQAIQTSAALTLPTLNAHIIDNGVLRQDQGYIWRVGGIMLAFSVVQIVFAIAAVRLGARIAMGFGRDVRNSLFHTVTGFSAREVNTIGAPSLITRITNDIQQIQMLVVMIATMAIAAPITMIVGVVMALRQDLGLSTILLVSMPASTIVLGVIVAGMVPAFRVMQDRIDEINRVLREQITGIRVVRAFVREREETRRFSRANADLTRTSLRAGRLMSSMFPTVNILVNLSSVGVLWLGADRVQSGAIEVGTIVAYLSYLLQILMSVVMATFMVSMIPRAAVSARRAQEVLDTTTSVTPPEIPVEPRIAAQVEFRGAGFHYPGAARAVLTDLSFVVGPGTTTAVIGSSGAGKTTLVNLIPRLFDVTSGSVLVGDVDVRDIDPEVLSGTLGLVPQKAYLFSGTVASNLRYGKPDATEAEMWAALRVAQAEDFVRAMPEQLDARIEQGGTNLSGGQRQRLSIARALIRRPEIFVFDDSFSALDLATDARLRAALPAFTSDSAVLIVAQRVSTIADADQIIVLEDGEMIGKGTYDELLAGCPTFAEIVQSQIGEKSETAA